MDVFVSLHTEGFSKSHWCQQEVGYAVARPIPIIPVRFDEIPDGFIQKNQALSRGEKTAEALTEEILEILSTDERVRDRLTPPAEVNEDDIPF